MESVEILSEKIHEIMEQRGINENEIQEVVNHALNGGVHLHSADGKHFLSKKRLGNFTLYAEYVLENDKCQVVNIYSHRVSLEEDHN